MKVLRVIATILFCIILFVSLVGLGLTITVNKTILNPEFVVSRVNQLEIASLANDFLSKNTQGQFPPEVTVSFSKTVTKMEPQLKQQLSAAVYPIYDYVNGKSKSIDLAQVLKNSLLKQEFLTAFTDDLDFSSLIKQLILEQVSIPSGLPISQDTITRYLNDAIAGAEPQIKQQLIAILPSVVDYMLGISNSLNATITLKPILDSVQSTAKADFLKSPPAMFAGLPPAQLEQVFNQIFAQIETSIPTAIVINENTLGDLAQVRFEITSTLAQVEQALRQARGYVAYVNTVFIVSLILTIVMIGLIILVNRKTIKTGFRALGVTFVVNGAIGLAGIYVGKIIAQPYLAQAQMSLPANMQSLIPRLLDDIIEPMKTFGIIVLIVGVALIVVSIIYKRGQAAKA